MSQQPSQPKPKQAVDGFRVIGDIIGGRSRIVAPSENELNSQDDLDSSEPITDQSLKDLAACYLFPAENIPPNSVDRVVLLAEVEAGVEASGTGPFCESGRRLAARYLRAFGGREIHVSENLRDVGDDDALVIFGAYKVHPRFQSYVEDQAPYRSTREINVVPDKGPGFKVRIRWGIEEKGTDRQIWHKNIFDQRLRKMKEREFPVPDSDSIKASFANSEYRHIETDYLLITALPTDARESQRVVTFCGLYYTGTLATFNLLDNSSASIFTRIDAELQGARYFQVLLKVAVKHESGYQHVDKIDVAATMRLRLSTPP
jgi:hypothetical protein